jgi:superfamily II DNA or RNA helicase
MADSDTVLNFSVCVHQSKAANRFIYVKQRKPPLTIKCSEHCDKCASVVHFFKERHQLDVKVIYEQPKEQPPPPAAPIPTPGRKRKTEPEPLCCLKVLYMLNDDQYDLKLPSVHARNTTPQIILKRLRQSFETPPNLPWFEHQEDVLRHFAGRDFTVRHSPVWTMAFPMGAGKTAPAFGILLNNNSPRNLVVCSCTQIGYMAEILERLVIEPCASKPNANEPMFFDIMGIQEFKNTFSSTSDLCHYTAAIVDESHMFKNCTAEMERCIHLLHAVPNIIALTGTPLVNDESEVNGVMRFINMDNLPLPYLQPDADEANRREVMTAFQQLLKGNVAYWNPKIHRPNMYKANYPSERTEVYRVPMAWPQTLEYLLMRKNTTTLGPYQISHPFRNTYNCQTLAIATASRLNPKIRPKADLIAEHIAHDPPENFPQVIYDDLIDGGVKLIQAALADKVPDRPMALITGETPNEERTELRTAYNAGQIPILGISRASATGLDLHGTQVMSLAAIFDNIPEERQTKCRVARLGSHNHSRRKEVVYRDYVSVFPVWSTLTPKALKQCADFFIKYRLGGRESEQVMRDINLKQELRRMLDEEHYETVEETINANNIIKFERLQVWLNAFFASSIPMRTQQDDAALLEFEAPLKAKRVYEGDEDTNQKRQRRRLASNPVPPAPRRDHRKRPAALSDAPVCLLQALEHPLAKHLEEWQKKQLWPTANKRRRLDPLPEATMHVMTALFQRNL